MQGGAGDHDSPGPCPHGAQSPVGQTDSKQTNTGFEVVINAGTVIKRKPRGNVLTNAGT